MKHPGEFLIEEIRARGLTQKDFSLMLWKSGSELNELIKWKRNITIQWDILLSQVLGSTEKYWIHKQIDYDYFLAKKESENLKSKVEQDIILDRDLWKVDPVLEWDLVEELRNDSKISVWFDKEITKKEPYLKKHDEEYSKSKIENIFRDF